MRDDDNSFIGGLIVIGLFVIAIILEVVLNVGLGVGSFGPTNTITITVNSKHVDSGKDSHYMVTSTDGQTFEVQNGWFLHTWNADQLYGTLKENHTYTVVTHGNQVVNMFYQEYPYITSVEEKK